MLLFAFKLCQSTCTVSQSFSHLFQIIYLGGKKKCRQIILATYISVSLRIKCRCLGKLCQHIIMWIIYEKPIMSFPTYVRTVHTCTPFFWYYVKKKYSPVPHKKVIDILLHKLIFFTPKNSFLTDSNCMDIVGIFNQSM